MNAGYGRIFASTVTDSAGSIFADPVLAQSEALDFVLRENR